MQKQHAHQVIDWSSIFSDDLNMVIV